jgi:hypothetical protein
MYEMCIQEIRMGEHVITVNVNLVMEKYTFRNINKKYNRLTGLSYGIYAY